MIEFAIQFALTLFSANAFTMKAEIYLFRNVVQSNTTNRPIILHRPIKLRELDFCPL